MDIPSDINVSHLENIVRNGWDDSNKTLNHMIISNARRLMPEILEKIRKPVLELKPTNEIIDPMPKLLLYKDDYYLIFSYVKYLENEGKADRALKIYVDALQGLSSIKDTTMISMIFRLVIEDIIIKSFDKKYFTTEQKKSLKRKFENVLIKDTQILWYAMERDRQGTLAAFKNGLFVKTKILNFENTNLSKKIIDRFDKMKYQYDKALYALDTREKLIEFENNFKKKSNEIVNKYLEWEKNKKSNSSEETVVILISDYLFAISNPTLVTIKLELWKSIEQNKKFLKNLE